jgi:hypothetical protein
MRIARKLTLLLTMAIAAMAFAASTASADEAISVVTEPGNVACNPCVIHVVGESSLAAFHVVTVSNCTDEFTANVNANGSGEVTTWNGSPDAPNDCTREQCRVQPGNTVREHWPFTSEEVNTNTVELAVQFCLSPVGDMTDASKAKCTADVQVTEEPAVVHHYLFNLSQECVVGGVPVEVHGSWEAEGRGVEFKHT